ncbi:DUF4157 domain-containing protein [Undibacterium sp. JH2W]|uniref:eCIS core domain-containing protein n=1 Tax=Undibacterium sp. JH2W TaxID=3413037 RepID=UPI003BF014F9
MKTTSAQQAKHQAGNAVTRTPGLPEQHRTFNNGVSNSALVQRQVESSQREDRSEANNTGLPDHLKTCTELSSGYALSDVKVHYNSSKPASVDALAFAQGTDIYLAPGQEQHLPHELWHVVQQKQGRVRPTFQMKSGVQVNADDALEAEADVMGHRMSGMKAEAASERSAGGNERSLFNIGSTSSSAPLQMQFESKSGNAKFKKAVKAFIKNNKINEKDEKEIHDYVSDLQSADQSYSFIGAKEAFEKKFAELVKEAVPAEVKEAVPAEVKEAVPAEVKKAVPKKKGMKVDLSNFRNTKEAQALAADKAKESAAKREMEIEDARNRFTVLESGRKHYNEADLKNDKSLIDYAADHFHSFRAEKGTSYKMELTKEDWTIVYKKNGSQYEIFHYGKSKQPASASEGYQG